MSEQTNGFCLFCIVVGVVLPWLLIFLSAVVALVGETEALGRVSAYSAAVGLVLLSVSYFFGRAANNFITRMK